MKPTRTILHWGLLIALVACQHALPPAEPASTPSATEHDAQPAALDPFQIAWDDRSLFRPGLAAGQEGLLTLLSEASVYHLDVRMDETLLRLTCRQEVRYINQEPDNLEEVWLRLFPNILGGSLGIESLEVDGKTIFPRFDTTGSAMQVPLSAPLAPGQAATVSMAFSLVAPTGGEGNYGMFGLEDGVLALAHFFPIIPAYDDAGWHVEIPPRHGDLLYADIAYYLVSVDAPLGVTLVASGTAVDRTTSRDTQRVLYASGPVRDFYLVAGQDYASISEQIGNTVVNSYAPAENAEGARAALGYAVAALKAFNAHFGPYPFTELDLVSTPTAAYGIEYPGILALAIRLYGPESAYPPVYLESTVAHEVSHQWFYSVVGNDQQAEPWLDEALAQYLTLTYYEHLYGTEGAEGFRSSLYERWSRVNDAPIPIGLAVADYSAQEYGAIVYGRGPLLIEALADVMGEGTFDAFLRDYYQTHAWGIATTASFQQLAEEHCSCDLDALFDDWVKFR